MKILFWLVKNKKGTDNMIPVYCRITINGKRIEMATGLCVKEEYWSAKRQRVKDKSYNSAYLNYSLLTIKARIESIFHKEKYLLNNNELTPSELKEKYLKRFEPYKTNGSEVYQSFRCKNCEYRILSGL